MKLSAAADQALRWVAYASTPAGYPNTRGDVLEWLRQRGLIVAWQGPPCDLTDAGAELLELLDQAQPRTVRQLVGIDRCEP